MKSKMTKLATATVILIAAGIIIHFSGGNVSVTTITFAELTEAMKTVPWMRMESQGIPAELPSPVDLWIGFESQIIASKSSDGIINFTALNKNKSYTYDSENNTVTIDYVVEKSLPVNMSSPLLFIEGLIEFLVENDAKITIKETEYIGQKVQLQEINLPGDEQRPSISLYIEPKTKLLLAMKGNAVSDGEKIFSYPKEGPKNIYDLGVPQDAKVIDKTQSENQ